MTKILGIEENVNSINDIKKYAKKFHIDLVNIPHKNQFLMNKNQIKFFKTKTSLSQLKELNQIKQEYALCIVSSWRGARLAYLANMNYIINFVGNDIRIPPFEKNSKTTYFSEPVNNLNFLQRKFYKSVFDNALGCVAASDETFPFLKKFREDGIRIDRTIVDTEIFNHKVLPKNVKKEKFTFFCPQRIGLEKGTDILWNAIKECKTDFEVIQCEWFDDTSKEASKKSKDILKGKPSQVKLIPKISREDIPKYYAAYDGILGEMRLGILNNIEREAAFFKKPIICYYNRDMRYWIDKKWVSAPFSPNSNDIKSIVEIIDKVVESKEFREDLIKTQFDFISDYANPNKATEEWENVFEQFIKKCKKSKIKEFYRRFFYVISHLTALSENDVNLS